MKGLISRKHILGLTVALAMSAPAMAVSNEVIINKTSAAAV